MILSQITLDIFFPLLVVFLRKTLLSLAVKARFLDVSSSLSNGAATKTSVIQDYRLVSYRCRLVVLRTLYRQ